MRLKLTRLLTRTSGLGAAVLSLFAAIGCGNGGTTIVHTSGGFSAASISGTYIYQLRGDSVNGPYREIGAFTADGAGQITAGSDDSSFNSGGLPVAFTGSYSVFGDGTGSITFNKTALGQITLAITIVSNTAVQLMEADSFADSAGTAVLQVATSMPTGTFAFLLHQEISAQSGASNSDVGFITISSGNVSGGLVDQNLGGTVSQLTITGGSVAAPANLGRGTATITDNSPFSTTLVYYAVSSGDLVLLVTNSGAVGGGMAEAQSGAVSAGLAGNYVFSSVGDDGVALNGRATVGQLSASGATINSGTFDSMIDGNYSGATSFNGSPTANSNNPSTQGRVQITLSTGEIVDIWLVTPARAFFQLENSSAIDIEDGTIDAQTVSSFSASTFNGQYALVMGGNSANGELARIGPMIFDGSGKLSLAELFNSAGSGAQPPQGGGLKGNYQVSASTPGRITGSLSNSSNSLGLVMYAVSGSQAYLLQTDTGTATSGTVTLQH